jgi:hypothetical protein
VKGWLGFVVWYERWRQYCFEPIDSKIFSADVKDFVDRVNREHKECEEGEHGQDLDTP